VISGILPIDKPAGWTSHDVVALVRRIAGQKAVGHAGTLDPLATGVLLIVLGEATRLSPYLMDTQKTYLACVVLGTSTTTDDAEGVILSTASLFNVTREDIERVASTFVGELDQIPPKYAAVRQGGQKLYQLARKGVEVDAPARRVTVHELTILAWNSPRLWLRVRCGSGTYIRALARDIGAVLGTGGYLHALRRTGSGSFSVGSCVGLEQLQQREDVLPWLRPSDTALLSWPALVGSDQDVARVRHGQSLYDHQAPDGNLRVYDSGGGLVALCAVERGAVRPFRVFAGGNVSV
jgi:tRNA pseudouridine55 synthase